MRKNLRALFTLALIAQILCLYSCAGLTPAAPASKAPIISPAQETQVSQNISGTPSPSPEDAAHVLAGNAELMTNDPMLEVYTRFSKYAMPDLVPSAKYGPLLPYVGEHFYVNSIWPSFASYGFVTAGGMLVTDAVFAYSSRHDQFGPDGKTVVKSVYRITKVIQGKSHRPELISAVCAHDGSWISQFEYTNVLFCDEVMLLFRDGKTTDFDAADYDGNILYSSKQLGMPRTASKLQT